MEQGKPLPTKGNESSMTAEKLKPGSTLNLPVISDLNPQQLRYSRISLIHLNELSLNSRLTTRCHLIVHLCGRVHRKLRLTKTTREASRKVKSKTLPLRISPLTETIHTFLSIFRPVIELNSPTLFLSDSVTVNIQSPIHKPFSKHMRFCGTRR